MFLSIVTSALPERVTLFIAEAFAGSSFPVVKGEEFRYSRLTVDAKRGVEESWLFCVRFTVAPAPRVSTPGLLAKIPFDKWSKVEIVLDACKVTPRAFSIISDSGPFAAGNSVEAEAA
ncbi:MAG: hypothetical protein HYV28_05460 [Ignavibacteriales bacterium]|nr:hypothetical protein [Ignavibacteriales bacterium]